MAENKRVWRKQSTRYVDAQSGARTTKGKSGAIIRREASKRFYGTLTLSDGTRKQVPLTQTKVTSLALLRRLQLEADRGRAIGVTPQQRKRDEPIAFYLDQYATQLRSRNRSEYHVTLTIRRAKDLLSDAGVTTARTIDANRVANAVSGYREHGKFNGGRRRKTKPSLETCNHYLRAVKAFTRWLWRSGVLDSDPLRGVSLFNANVGRRKVRRAMSVDELRLLITTTEAAKPHRGARTRLTGPQRAMLYAVAASTGLRASELASLTRSSFDLESGTVRIKAEAAKGKKADVLPMPQSVVARLGELLDPLSPTESVWPGTWAEDRHAGVMFKRDAERAGLTVRNDDGATVDFHALRTSYITSLARSGVHPAVAQRLARHSTITLTMDVYTKLEDSELRETVEELPDLFANRPH